MPGPLWVRYRDRVMQAVRLPNTAVKLYTDAAEESLRDDPQHVVDPNIRAQVVAPQAQLLDDAILLPARAAPVTGHLRIVTDVHLLLPDANWRLSSRDDFLAFDSLHAMSVSDAKAKLNDVAAASDAVCIFVPAPRVLLTDHILGPVRPVRLWGLCMCALCAICPTA